MGNLNYIVFGGVDSRDYGIYISGEGVFNAPERDVEVVNIPGKDGDLLIDRGRFLNIQVTYPGFNFEPDLSTFAERLRAFRAALASQVGYQRLEDSFHPDEFRLASFRSGLDVKPVMYNTASTVGIVFDCKPQRFLKSGEEEITIGEWGETETVSGSIATFEAESNTGIKSLVVDIEPIQSGTGDPSPTNIRPISGWSGVEVGQSGTNVFDEVMEIGTIGASTGENSSASDRLRTKNFIAVKSGVQYYSKIATRLLFYDESKTYMGIDKSISLNNASAFTVPNGACYMRFGLGSSYGTTYKNDISINYPSTDTSYHPYQGTTITKSLGRTVYGGTLDLISGELTITKQIFNVNFSGRTGTSQSGKYGWYSAVVPNIIKPAFTVYPTGMLCNRLAVGTRNESYNGLKDCVSIHQTEGRIYTYVESLSAMTLADAQAWLAENPIQVAYPLETPEVIQLTGEQIQTLLGDNNIWADSGEVSVEYGADPNILVNPTPFEALPLIEVVGVGSLTVGNITVTITGDSTQDIFIDSDIMEAYEDDNGAIISKNDRISLSGMHFPTLGTETGITYTGLTSVTVTPRWWTI